MKTHLLFLAAIISMLLISCKKDDINTPVVHNLPSNPGTPEIVTNVITTGVWKVSHFHHKNKNQTSKMVSFSFKFSTSGTCSSDNGMQTYSGIWHSGWDNNEVKLKILFPVPTELAEISEDWIVLETTETKIRLENVSGGNGTTDLLTFKKL